MLATLLGVFAVSCGDDDDSNAVPPTEPVTVASVEISSSQDSTLVLFAASGDTRRVELGDGIGVLALSCRKDGSVLLAVTRGGRLLPPLLVTEGEGVFLRDVPAGRSPSWVDARSFLWQTTDASGRLSTTLYGLDGMPLGGPVPGGSANYLFARKAAAVSRGFGPGEMEAAIYLVPIDAFSAGEPSFAEGEVLSRIPFNPIQLDPSGRHFVLTTAAAENNQLDVQTVTASGGDLQTLTATPEQERGARWTAEGDLVFIRERLRDQGEEDEQPAAADIVLLGTESHVETVLGRGKGIDLLAACG